MRQHHALCAAVLCFVLLISTAQAGDDPIDDAIDKIADKSLYAKLLESLKLRAEEEKTPGTWFVPSDRAMNAFLKEMGMTAQELLARPQLVDAILSYHFVPGVTLKDFTLTDKDKKEVISKDAKTPSILKTGDVDNDIEIFRSSNTGLPTLVDAQGNRASVLGKPLEYGKMVFWDVSNVLLSGQYFTSTRAAVKFYPEWSSFQELYQRAALNSKTLADAFAGSAAYTYLLPTNAALKPAMQALSKAGNADLVQLLEYHVLPQLRPVPTGWKDGETVKTLLEGRTLKAQLTQSPYTDPFTGSTVQGPELAVAPEVGKPAKVTVPNIYAGKSVIQGIDGPLVPNTAVAKVLGGGAKTADEKASTGRRLMQGNRGGAAQKNSMWGAQNTQAAIRAAASGRAPASYATTRGSSTARNANQRCVNCVGW